jgi:hypothetical protein
VYLKHGRWRVRKRRRRGKGKEEVDNTKYNLIAGES